MSDVANLKSTFDFAKLGELRAQAAEDPKNDAAISTASKQFEALFLQMMLKSMRDAMPEGGLFNSSATKTFEQMYDQQIVMAMSERGSTGIAEMVESFIRKSHTGFEAREDAFFSLETTEPDQLPLINQSDALPLSEESTATFLLNRVHSLGPRTEP